MAVFALVGTIGGALQSASGGALSTLAWGTSENRTAGNLLICWATVTGTATLPVTPSGWSIGVQVAGTSCSATVYYKVAASSDAAPTIAAITSGIISGQLAEYSGGVIAGVLDQSGTHTGTTSAGTATAGAVSDTKANLIISAAAAFYSAAATKTFSETYNNGGTATRTQNSGTSTAAHYDFAYGIATGNGSAQNHAFTFTTASITGEANVVATFTLRDLTATITDTSTPADTAANNKIQIPKLYISVSDSTTPADGTPGTITVGTLGGDINNTITMSTTSSTSKLVALAGVHQGTVSNVTLNGVGMTKVIGAATTFNETAEIWYIDNPGALTGVALTSSISGGSGDTIGYINLKNTASGTAALTAVGVDSSGSSGVSAPLTPTTNNNVVIGSMYSEGTVTGIGDTTIFSVQGASYENGAGSYAIQTTAALDNVAFTLGSGQRWADAAAAFGPALTPSLSISLGGGTTALSIAVTDSTAPTDSVGQILVQNNIQVTDSTTVWDGLDWALSLDGSSQYVSITYNSLMHPTDIISLEAEITQKDWTGTVHQQIISTTESGGYVLELNESGVAASPNVAFGVRANGSYQWVSYNITSLGWTPNSKHHLVGTFDGRYLKLYLDNTLQATTDLASTYAIQYSVNTDLFLGADPSGASPSVPDSPASYFGGSLANAGVWHSTLSTTDVTNHYGHVYDFTNAIGFWRLREGTGTTGTDSSANGFTANLKNTPSWVVGIGSPRAQLLLNDNIAVTDSTAPNDSLPAQGPLITNYISVSDATSPTDLPTLTLGGGVTGLSISVVDTTTPTDSVLVQIPQNYISVLDSTAPADSISQVLIGNYISVSDSTTPTDTVAIQIPKNYINIIDSTTPVDSIGQILVRNNINVSDSTTPSDSVNVVMPAVINVTGTVVPYTDENGIKTGGKTIILTVTGDTWIAAGAGSFDLQRQNIINGLTSAQSELLGWNNVVKALQSVTGVVRTSNTVVTITLDAEPTYSMTANETITVTVPGTALIGGSTIVATPTFQVIPDYYIILTDSTTPTDSAIVQIPQLYISVNDSTAPSDNVAVQIPILYISVLDTTIPADAIGQVLIQNYISVSDSTTVTDLVIVQIPANYINVNDSTTPSDIVGQVLVQNYISVLDTTTPTDTAIVQIPTLYGLILDTTTPTDSVNVQIPANYISVSDGTTLSDSPTLSITFNVNVNDGTSVTDTVSIQIPNNYINVVDSTAPVDSIGIAVNQASLSINVTDSINADDPINVQIPNNYISVIDFTLPTDIAIVQIPTLYISLVDNTAPTDLVNVLEPFYNINVNDFAQPGDSSTLDFGQYYINVTDQTSPREKIDILRNHARDINSIDGIPGPYRFIWVDGRLAMQIRGNQYIFV